MFLNNDQVTLSYTSVNKHTVRSTVDIGLPPPAIKHASLSNEGRTSLRLCEKRKFLFSFQGRDVSFCIRVLLPACIATLFLSHCSNCSFILGNSFGIRKKPWHILTHQILDNQASYIGDIQKGGDDSNDYITILTQSIFAGSPRGDQRAIASICCFGRRRAGNFGYPSCNTPR